MPSRDTLIIYARSIAANYVGAQNGSVQSWETLQAIYQDAMESPPDWTHNVGKGTNLDAIKAGRWLRKDGTPGGTMNEQEGIAWCGIFATYVLRGCGVPIKWRNMVGPTPLPPYLERLFGFGNRDKIAPGDICVKGANQHHFIVYDRQGNTLYSYDGNLPGQSVGTRTNSVNDVHTIYRPLF